MNISREYINHLKKNRYGYKVPQYNKNFSSGSKKLTPEEKKKAKEAAKVNEKEELKKKLRQRRYGKYFFLLKSEVQSR